MNGSEILAVISEAIGIFDNSISLKYKHPVAEGSCHAIDLENEKFIGLISL